MESGSVEADDHAQSNQEELAKRREAKYFTTILHSGMVVLAAAATATMQARQLLIVEAAKQINEAAVAAANSSLAAAYSAGAFAEFLLSPGFGKLSDSIGRKPVMLLLQVVPALMRSLVFSIRHPPTRVRLCCVDFFSARCVGIQPAIVLAGTMLTDVFPPGEQSSARARLFAAQSLGQIAGNYAGGWVSSMYGPESTYVMTAMGPLTALCYFALLLPESYARRGAPSSATAAIAADGQGPQSKTAEAEGEKPSPDNKPSGVATQSRKRSLFSDARLCILGAGLGLYEFMNYAPMNSVAIYLMKERLGWGPLHTGRFASGFSLASFIGSLLASHLIRIYGQRTHVTITAFMNAIGYTLWGSAASGKAMLASLVCFALGSGGTPVMQTRFVQRAQELGLTRGEAGAAMQAIGALGRALAPQLVTGLWLRAVQQQSSRVPRGSFQLPVGSPMYAVAVICLVQEVMHQVSWRC